MCGCGLRKAGSFSAEIHMNIGSMHVDIQKDEILKPQIISGSLFIKIVVDNRCLIGWSPDPTVDLTLAQKLCPNSNCVWVTSDDVVCT